MKLALLALVFISLFAEVSAAQEQAPPSEQQIREWIDQLVNTSSPRRYRSPSDRLTAAERKSLEPVQEAFGELTRNFRPSLPILIEHLGDDRFSYPREHPTSGVFENQDIGDACHAIIQGKVLPTSMSFIDSRGIGVWVELPLNEDWYKDVSKMSLYEMQVDAIDRLLKTPRLKGVSAKAWDRELKSVREFREEFVRKGEAIDHTFGPAITGK